jgi:hypothetical protein
MQFDLNDISLLDDQLVALNKSIREARDAFCAKHCTVKVGDIITVNGYSHEGKKMEVYSVFCKKEWHPKTYKFYAKGLVLKADGTPGKNKGE